MFPNNQGPIYRTWQLAVSTVLAGPPRRNVLVSKAHVSHPSREDCIRAVGEPIGQIADWSKHLTNNGRLHIIEFPTYYKVHWDEVDPSTDPIGHLERDAPQWGTAIKIGVGLAILGGLLGALAYSESEKNNRDGQHGN
jgi:hypothetical protein